MYFLAIATDYDGTIAHHGSVKAETVAALKKCKESGRRLILVTGRELPELLGVFPLSTSLIAWWPKMARCSTAPTTKKERAIRPPRPRISCRALKRAL